MRYWKHYFKIIFHILSTNYSYSKTDLLLDYLRLISRSIIHHKIKRHQGDTDHQCARLVGFEIVFFTYQQIINLVEEIFIFQVYKFSTTQQAPSIIDAGSNIGLSILYFKKLHPQSHITAFEPDLETYHLLQRNISTNKLCNVTLHNCALGAQNEESFLYKQSLVKGSLNMSLIASVNNPFTEIVPTRMLSSYILHQEIDMIKIDVEGSELKIIEDLIHSGKINLIKKMIIEFHPDLNDTSIDGFAFLLKRNNFCIDVIIDLIHPGAKEILIVATNRVSHFKSF